MRPTLPKTCGRWMPIVRGRGTPVERVVGWLEVFPARGRWVSVPGSSRVLDAQGQVSL